MGSTYKIWKVAQKNTVEYVIKYSNDPGIDKIKEVDNCMPSNLEFFVLLRSKSLMNVFVHEIDGFYSKKVFDQDAESLYIQEDH